MKYLYLILLCILSQYSFAQVEKMDIKKTYDEIYTLYPKMLVNHFIDFDSLQIVYLHVDYPGSTRYQTQVHAMFLYDGKQIDTLEKIIKQRSIKEYHFTDSCLMVVAYDSTIYDASKFKIRQCSDFSKMLPIPNFQYYFESQLPSEFFEKANIYILESKKGKFMKNKFLSVEDIRLPKCWKHGYNKGIVISGNLVAYWMEVW